MKGFERAFCVVFDRREFLITENYRVLSVFFARAALLVHRQTADTSCRHFRAFLKFKNLIKKVDDSSRQRSVHWTRFNRESACGKLGAEQKVEVNIWEDDDVLKKGEKGVNEIAAARIVVNVEKHGDQNRAQMKLECAFARSIRALANDWDAI